MALESDNVHGENLAQYQRLVRRKDQIIEHTTIWMNQGTAFYQQLTDPAEKAEMQALKDLLINDLRAVLGV